MSNQGTPLPAASFPLPPPLGKLPIGEVRGGLVYFNGMGLEFMTKLWAGMQGNGGVTDQIAAIYNQFLEIPLPAGTAFSAHRVITVGSDGRIRYPAIATLSDGLGVIGLSVSSATVAGETVKVQIAGEIVEPSWAWTAGLPIYCADQGVLSQTPPNVSGQWLLRVGTAISSSAMLIEPRELVSLG